MRRIRPQRPSAYRGFAMVFALFIITLMLVVGLAMLSVSQSSSANTRNLESKQGSFNAAEAGLDKAIDSLDTFPSFSSTAGINGSLANGYHFTYYVYNYFVNPSPPTFTDPVTGDQIQVPVNHALIISTGKGPNGERPTTIESIVKNIPGTLTFPNDAIDAGLDIQGVWNNKIGLAGSSPGANNANIHANHNVTATVGFLQGTSTASGTVNSLNSGPTGVNTPQVVLPTNQLPGFVASELSIAQSGGPYAKYISAGGSLPTTFTCPSYAPAAGCTIFYDGSLSIAANATYTFTGKVILVINGNFSSTGNSVLKFGAGTQSIFVVNGNADIGGNGTTGALIWVKGDTTLHGNANYTGAIVSGGNVIFNGGGSGGGFLYDGSLKGVQLPIPGHVVITTFGEY
jgi:hypothetical protein